MKNIDFMSLLLYEWGQPQCYKHVYMLTCRFIYFPVVKYVQTNLHCLTLAFIKKSVVLKIALWDINILPDTHNTASWLQHLFSSPYHLAHHLPSHGNAAIDYTIIEFLFEKYYSVSCHTSKNSFNFCSHVVLGLLSQKLYNQQ